MGKVLVLGGGVAGLSTAILLGRDGHEVVVLERDPDPPPDNVDEMWSCWTRRGVNQFHQAHYFQPRMTAELRREVPEVIAAAEALGALSTNLMDLAAPLVGSSRRPGDEIYDLVTARRPVMEAAFAQVAATTPGVEVRRGVAVAGLLAKPADDGNAPRVVGVRTEGGDDLMADLVVDTGGRRSALPRWLEAIGARPPVEEREDFGFTYYGRYFRGDALPEMRAPLLTAYGSVSVLALPADNNTWVLAVICLAGDAPLRAMLDPTTFERVLHAFPLLTNWLGEPLTDDVATMAGLYDRLLRYVVDGEPVATGVLAVGDSWACSNPSLGRGATIGFLHALALRDTVRATGTDDVDALARAFDDATVSRVEPWYSSTLGIDRERRREIDCAIAGETYELPDPGAEIGRAMGYAASFDEEVFRQFARIGGMLATVDEVFTTPGLLERVIELGADWRDHPFPGPSRDELLALLAG